jgi:hypothetical protein
VIVRRTLTFGDLSASPDKGKGARRPVPPTSKSVAPPYAPCADADGFECGLLDAFDSRIAGTPRTIEVEDVSELTPMRHTSRWGRIREKRKAPRLRGFSIIGAPRFELGTSSPPGVQAVDPRGNEGRQPAWFLRILESAFPSFPAVSPDRVTLG